METIRSKDGTPIAYEKSGTGAPLVLVHGTSADHTRWAPVLPALERNFTVYAVDRRGRGGSGDNPAYSIEREFEDIATVVNDIPELVDLLGHSYGGICSLEAASHVKNLRRLILYEPPIPVGGESVYSPDVITQIRAELEAGDRDASVCTFFREIVRVTPSDLILLKSSPAWKGRMASAHTVLRELEAGERDYHFKPDKFHALKVPTLLLVGGDSPKFLKSGSYKLNEAIPNSRIALMPGQQHVAMNSAPELFLQEVVGFLT